MFDSEFELKIMKLHDMIIQLESNYARFSLEKKEDLFGESKMANTYKRLLIADKEIFRCTDEKAYDQMVNIFRETEVELIKFKTFGV